MIFDTHAHYDDEAFDEDRDEILRSLHSHGIDRIANVGVDIKTCEATIDLAEKYPFIYAVIGFHPSDVKDMKEDALGWLTDHVCDSKKIVAIGEIGLDYHWSETEEENEKQKLWFEKQIDIAKKSNLPIVVHSREAAADTMDIIVKENASECGGIIHCYSYAAEQAKQYADMGFYIGVGGVITFKNSRKLRESVLAVGLDHIVLETDCPYLAPEPYRGKRNFSAYLTHVVRALSELLGVSEETIIDTTTRNAERVYGLAD